MYFMGENKFLNNNNSALAAITTGIHITTNATVDFIGNAGRYGGAIALLGAAFIETHPLSRRNFVQNSATIAGGAIYEISIGKQNLINCRNCFIRYSDITVPHKEWTSTFFFSGNLANGTNDGSIFASSLQLCRWDGAYTNTSEDLSKVFCWKNWDYNGSNCTTEVRTLPRIFESHSNFSIEVFPGKRNTTNLTMWDD